MTAIGVARADDADMLAAAHADIVVTTLDAIDTAALAKGRLTTSGGGRTPDRVTRAAVFKL